MISEKYLYYITAAVVLIGVLLFAGTVVLPVLVFAQILYLVLSAFSGEVKNGA